jgi:hypothetical protein
MLHYDQRRENDNSSFLPQKEMFLYFPKPDEICERISDPSPKLVRNIFHVRNFLEEEDKVIDTLKTLLKDYIDKTKQTNKSKDLFTLNKICDNREELLRYLNYNNYDAYQTLNMLKLFANLLEKYRIKSHVEFSEKIGYVLNYGFIQCLGRDKKYRPILWIDFRKYDSKLIKQIENKDIIEIFVYYINFVIEKMMLPGQIEQFNVIIQIDSMDSSNFLNNFKDIIFTIQMYFPSRLHRLFVLTFKNTIESSFSLIENYLLLYNKERMVIANRKKYKSLFKEISQDTLKDFLEPLLNSNHSSSTNDPNEFNKNNAHAHLKGKNDLYFPPKVNNNIIFDNEDEKKGLHMEIEDYLNFVKENEGFYIFENKLFANNMNSNPYKSKEFPEENHVTYEKIDTKHNTQEDKKRKKSTNNRNESDLIRLKIINSECNNNKELIKDAIRVDDEVIPKACSGNKSSKYEVGKANLTDGIQFITRTRSSNRTNQGTKNSLSERENHYRRNSMTHGSWKKNLTIKIYDNMDSTQNSNIKLFVHQSENLSTSQKRERHQSSNLVFENQGRGDTCCKNLNNCSIF